MASATSLSSQLWQQALILRKRLMEEIGKLQAESVSGVDMSRFEATERLLQEFRRSSVHIIFLDFPRAVEENVEGALWTLHTSINSGYRFILGRLKRSSHVVEKHKVEKSCVDFLRVSQRFYKGYIQRLAARYDIPELRRIAKGIKADEMDDTDQISPVVTELRGMVLESCHSTLLHLGDLSRYRAEAKHKKSCYETALTCYSLARQLKPKSGLAYHQMGMVHLDQGNHLDIVYYFYRSWAVKSCHPNAKSNLEAEFKSLKPASSSGSGHNASSSQDALFMWFVRLHALFYKGDNFPQQAEMETEIMHRLEMACHSEKSTDTLLKMIMVNIAAHHIAAAKYAESQTLTASRFYYFTLRFNALFMSKFCATLGPELKEAICEEATSAEESKSASVKGARITPIVEALLPVLRLYSMWLSAHRQEICAAMEAFGGLVPELVQTLAKVFTLLCVFTYSQDALASCPYLLPEDLEIRGFDPLSESIVPEACRCFCSEDGSPKTHLENQESRLAPAQESSSRVLDILRCAYFLADDATLPLSCRVADGWLIFECSTGTSSATPAATPVPTASHITVSKEVSDVNNSNGSNGSMTNEKEHRFEPSEPSNQTTNHPTPDCIDLRPQSTLVDLLLEDYTDDAENRVFKMLTPFLKPPSPRPHQQQGGSPTESSYGMHSGTANELLGSFQTDPSPTISAPSGVPSGKFTPLPWAWFNTPKPNGSMGSLTPSGRDAFSAQLSPYDSPRNTLTTETLPYDPFTTPGRNHYGAFTNGNAAMQSSCNFSTPDFPGAEPTNYRNRMFQPFSATNIPRSSPFTQWADTQKSTEENNGCLPRQSKVVDRAAVAAAAPQCTGTSAFSHPSSLYQGTPAGVVGLGLGSVNDQ